MRKIKGILFVLLFVVFIFPVSTIAKPLPGKNTLVVCKADNPDQSIDTDFKKLYPNLVLEMNRFRGEGIVNDIYFMRAISEGVVFFATSKGGDSQANAEKVIAKIQGLIKKSASKRRVTCSTQAVGPKAGSS